MPNIKTFTCKNCLISVNRAASADSAFAYCSNVCQREYQNKILIRNWLDGNDRGWSGKTRQLKSFIRKYLMCTRGTACGKCGWNELHPVDNKPLTEINHIDGDAENCVIDNLEILCPNCHAKTPNFRARNKRSKRARS